MSRPIIEVRNLSKVYRLGSLGATSLKEELERVWNGIRGRKEDKPAGDFWALRDVSFEVKPGDVVGIIGRNGAGKSTLLKILSRITPQSSGEITLRGRVASLLEVGTGFHGDLTGRENIFLNGAILGMTRAEIRQKLDQIVDFSGVEKFLDTPVKRYSSGMYVRLAFAVAAHLDPEILIIDEVLAFGDIEFQNKCLGKMKDVASGGRTVLFVSHNLAAVQNLCTSGIMLRNGTVAECGDIGSAVNAYLSESKTADSGCVALDDHSARSRHGARWLTRLTLRDGEAQPSSRFGSSRPMSAVIDINPPREIVNPRIAIAIEDQYGRRIGTSATYFDISNTGRFSKPFSATVSLPSVNLGPGRYLLSVSISERGHGLLDSIDSATWFEVEWDNTYTTGESYDPVYGPVVIKGKWQVTQS